MTKTPIGKVPAGHEVGLNWESTYGIALELRRRHPQVRMEDVTLRQVYEWTLELSEFHDDPALGNDEILNSIYQEWYEVILHDGN